MGAVPQLALALLLLGAIALADPAGADEGLWRRLTAGGQVVLLRHGTTTPDGHLLLERA